MPAVDLATLSPDDLRPLADEIRGTVKTHAALEEAAQAVAETLYRSLVAADGSPACALVRVYKAHRYDRLDGDLQEFATGVLGREPGPDVRCLTLLGTAGDEPAWNDRRASTGHQAIPLPSEDFVRRLPMVAQLITQLGLEIGDVLSPPAEGAVHASQQSYDVFHVEHAAGSPHLPAQDFVERYGIRSAVGFGGILLSGDFYAAVLFSKVLVDEGTARTLRILALPLRVALTPMVGRAVFA